MKKNIHIIYVVEDGVSSLVCGVGTIAYNFLNSFEDIHNYFLTQNINLKLSVVSLKYKKSDIGFQSNLLKGSKKICETYGGSLVLVDQGKKYSENYFDFLYWENINYKVRKVLKKIYRKEDDLTIIISNDTMFVESYLFGERIINIWLPNSLSFLHKQSYVDQVQRENWEMRAINRIIKYNDFYIGSVSNYITRVIRKKYKIKSKKIVNLNNGFYLPSLKLSLKNELEISHYLKKRKIPQDRDIIFCFGRADEYKGLDISLESMLKICQKHNFYPVLVASKFSDEKLIDKIQNHLEFLANKSKQPISLFFGYEFELPKYLLQYKKVKYLINMPTNDFCPLIPYEAEIIGHDNLCVVNSNIDCFKDVINDMKDGFICTPKPSCVVNKIDKILDLSSNMRNNIIKAGKIRAIKQVNLKNNYIKGLESIIVKYI